MYLNLEPDITGGGESGGFGPDDRVFGLEEEADVGLVTVAAGFGGTPVAEAGLGGCAIEPKEFEGGNGVIGAAPVTEFRPLPRPFLNILLIFC